MSVDGPSRDAASWLERLRQRPRLSAGARDRLREIVDRVLGTDALWSLLLVATCLALIAGPGSAPLDPSRLRLGTVAPFDVRTPYDVDVVDEVLTAERRRTASAEALDVYVHDVERGRDLAAVLAGLFRDGRARLDEASLRGDVDPTAQAREHLAGRVREDVLDTLLGRRFDAALERQAIAALTDAMDRLVIGNRALLGRAPAILVLRVPGRRAQRVDDYAGFVDVEAARAGVTEALGRDVSIPAREKRAFVAFVASFVDANVHYDSDATHERRAAAAATVPPVVVRVAGGEILVRQGEIVTQAALDRLAAARRQPGATFGATEGLGWSFVLGVLAFFVWRYCSYHQRRFRKVRRLHALFVVVLLGILLLAHALPWVVARVVSGLGSPYDDPGRAIYLIPFGAGAVLMALLANGRVATVHAGFTTILCTLVSGRDAYAMAWTMIVQLAGVYAITAYRERVALLRAGLVVGTVGGVAALAVELLRSGPSAAAGAPYSALLAWVGGAAGVGLLVSFALPLLERLFRVLTDVRLLELSNANHPLLSQLAVQAPGSYNHSLVVGTLAEEGAKAIGANALLCRVSGFYHDIGKLSHPEYYVENQRGVNPHDHIDPGRSAEILAAHVTDGIRMAREAGLPQQIVDIIPQHHGTRTMAYFLDKARRAMPALGRVRDDAFRYPGPKPQTREAAIFMLADAVEAAARTVEEPTAVRFHEMIRQVTQAIILDRQLDECDLTFADLERVQDALLRSLVSMHHQRVEYPGFDFGEARSRAARPGARRR